MASVVREGAQVLVTRFSSHSGVDVRTDDPRHSPHIFKGHWMVIEVFVLEWPRD